MFCIAGWRLKKVKMCISDPAIPIYMVFQKVAPIKLFGIFLFWLSLFARNFANLLAIHSHTYLSIFVDLP